MMHVFYRGDYGLGRSPVNPAMANVLILATENSITLQATDFELGLSLSMPAVVEEAGEVAVNAVRFAEITSQLPDGEASLDGDKNRLSITCGAAIKVKLDIYPADEVPRVEIGLGVERIEIKADTLARLIAKTAYVTPSMATRNALHGVFLWSDGSTIGMAAVDGHRLAEATADVVTREIKHCLIPKKGAREISRIAAEAGDKPLSLAVDEAKMVAICGEEKLLVRLIDDQFPDYRSIIPQDAEITATVGTKAFTGALKRAMTVADIHTDAVSVSVKAGLLEVAAQSAGIGEMTERIDADYSGVDVTFGMNGKYILEAINALGGENITINIKNSKSPIIYKTGADKGAIALIMPMFS